MVETNFTSVLSLVSKTFSLTNALDGIDASRLDVFAGKITNLTAPDGTILYANSSFASPDTTESAITKTGLPTLLDTDGNVVQGDYAFSYQVRVRQNIKVTIPPDIADSFRIKGDWTDNLPAVGQNLTIAGGTNAGTHQISSKTYDSGADETYVVFSAFIGTWNTGGYSDGLGYVEFTLAATSKTLDFTYVSTTPSITITSDCAKSLLTSRDTTDLSGYLYTINSRLQTISYPKMKVPLSDITSSAQTVNVSPIYTKTWTVQLNLNVTADFGDGFTVYEELYATKNYDVTCSEKLCSIYTCMQTLVDSWQSQLGNNPKNAEFLYNILKKVEAHFMLYQVAVSCGDQAAQEVQLGIMIDLLKTVGCSSCTTDTDQPVKVISLIGDVETLFGGYTFYMASLTQSSTSSPTATLFNSTLNGTPVWTRTGTGVYRATLTGGFPIATTVVTAISLNNPTVGYHAYAVWGVSADYIEVKTFNASNVAADGILSGAFIEIRVLI